MRINPPRTIIAPVDFSETSLAGLSAAKLLAKRWRSALKLVHVNESTPAEISQSVHTAEDKAALEKYYRGLESRMRELVKDFREVEACVIDGYAKDVIGKLADDVEDCWVVMGTHGHGGLRDLVLGSKAQSAVCHSVAPVLTVRTAPKPPWPKRILVPVKFCDYANRALVAALDLARETKARVSALHVVEEDVEIAENPDVLREHVKLLSENHGVHDFDWILETGEPAEVIVKWATPERFDLVVLAAHRKPFLENLFHGITAGRVLSYSPVPVLTMPMNARVERERTLLMRSIRKA